MEARLPGFAWSAFRRFKPPAFLRAAHYFADGWPLDSLMVFRQPALRRDFRALRADGFNTVILVVPWRGFQRSPAPPSYDPFLVSQLRLALREARRAGLAVLLRVAYTHQVLPGPEVNGIRRAQELLTDPAVEAAWLDYHRFLGELVAAHDCVIGAFLSWEEFWHAFGAWQSLDGRQRRDLAVACGYTAFLAERGLADPGTVVRIPRREEPEHAHYHAFMNARIRVLFGKARERFPALGIEFRCDKDGVQGEAVPRWLENDPFFDLEPARYSYWAPFMGARNEGESLDADQAAGLLAHMLGEVTADGRYPGHVMEQFNFIDATRKYAASHARIAEGQVPAFLAAAAPLLRERTGGYGLWAWRDYRCNILYNAAFLDSGRGWTVSDGRRLRRGGIRLYSAGTLSQRLHPRVAGVPPAHPFTHLTLRVQLAGKGSGGLEARLNGGSWVPLRPAADGRVVCAELPVVFEALFREGLAVDLRARGGRVSLHRAYLYHTVYRGEVRDEEGTPAAWLDAVRELNERLAEPAPVQPGL